jgi:AraC family ethanolamine operon transcriptional activator
MRLSLKSAEFNPANSGARFGVSERTLQYAFRDRFGLTPAAFIKARRLAAVSAMLKRADAELATVGDIAAQFGFWHSGQFAADYKRAFGELPSDTLRENPLRRR